PTGCLTTDGSKVVPNLEGRDACARTVSSASKQQELIPGDSPEQRHPQIQTGEASLGGQAAPEREGQAAPERKGQEARNDLFYFESGRDQVLLGRDVRQGERMVGAIEVLASAVLEIRAHDREDAVGGQRLAHAGQEVGDRVGVREV